VSRRSGTPSRFDPSFYRTHDPLGYIPSDAQSVKSQATYASGVPPFTAASGPFSQGLQRTNGAKRNPYSGAGYASSVISQDPGTGTIETSSVVGSSVPPSERGGPDTVNSIAYSQSDRLRHRLSFSSLGGGSDLGSSLSALDYKSQDDAADLDDMRSQYSHSQSGFTEF
jgi:regulator of nonsense transcripts 1